MSRISFQKLEEGILNQTFTCLHKDDTEKKSDGLFIRINGVGLEGVWVDRQREIR